MKVKELIEHLKDFNPELDVLIHTVIEKRDVEEPTVEFQVKEVIIVSTRQKNVGS